MFFRSKCYANSMAIGLCQYNEPAVTLCLYYCHLIQCSVGDDLAFEDQNIWEEVMSDSLVTPNPCLRTRDVLTRTGESTNSVVRVTREKCRDEILSILGEVGRKTEL